MISPFSQGKTYLPAPTRFRDCHPGTSCLMKLAEQSSLSTGGSHIKVTKQFSVPEKNKFLFFKKLKNFQKLQNMIFFILQKIKAVNSSYRR